MWKRKTYTITINQYRVKLGQQTKIMGVLNVTSDSFSRDGCLSSSSKKTIAQSIRRAQRLIREGADILDIGGESARPGAEAIPAKEEADRIIPVIKQLAQKIDVPISVDTYKPLVAQQALDAGANIINNIMGTKTNKSLLKMIKNYDAAVVLMHMKGQNSKTMQKNIRYESVIDEIIKKLQRSIENCLEIGIKSDKLIIDPGIGFGKTVEHNLEIINRLSDFKKLNRPLLLGTSRKSFIGTILNKDVDQRLMGTIASVCAGIIKGAHIIRVHDIAAIKQAISVTDAIINEQNHTGHS